MNEGNEEWGRREGKKCTKKTWKRMFKLGRENTVYFLRTHVKESKMEREGKATDRKGEFD